MTATADLSEKRRSEEQALRTAEKAVRPHDVAYHARELRKHPSDEELIWDLKTALISIYLRLAREEARMEAAGQILKAEKACWKVEAARSEIDEAMARVDEAEGLLTAALRESA